MPTSGTDQAASMASSRTLVRVTGLLATAVFTPLNPKGVALDPTSVRQDSG